MIADGRRYDTAICSCCADEIRPDCRTQSCPNPRNTCVHCFKGILIDCRYTCKHCRSDIHKDCEGYRLKLPTIRMIPDGDPQQIRQYLSPRIAATYRLTPPTQRTSPGTDSLSVIQLHHVSGGICHLSEYPAIRPFSPDHSWESSANECAMARNAGNGPQQRAFRTRKNTGSAQRWALRAGKSPAHGSGPCSSVFIRVRKRFVIPP